MFWLKEGVILKTDVSVVLCGVISDILMRLQHAPLWVSQVYENRLSIAQFADVCLLEQILSVFLM